MRPVSACKGRGLVGPASHRAKRRSAWIVGKIDGPVQAMRALTRPAGGAAGAPTRRGSRSPAGELPQAATRLPRWR